MTRSPWTTGASAAVMCGSVVLASIAPRTSFTKVYELGANEGVFAYARISPDGRDLVYASERQADTDGRTITRELRVLDLGTHRALYEAVGIDGYWSNDGSRIIYRSLAPDGRDSVNIWHKSSGQVSQNIAPVSLGDYFSWGVKGGRDLVLTINGNYFYLDGDREVLPVAKLLPCDGIGTGERPLISKDGRRVTAFVKGNIVIRDLADCADIVDTHIGGAKADFSFDGRYIAFHVPKASLDGYEIQVVDTVRRTVRTATNLPGSSLFPSWTRDGRLCFRYDSKDFRGFMLEDGVLSLPERPLQATQSPVHLAARWLELFPETPLPAHHLELAMIWAPWSAHSPTALTELQRAVSWFIADGQDVGAVTAVEIGSQPVDVGRFLMAGGITVPRIPLSPRRFLVTEAVNQIPTTLLFRDGVEADRRLGAQTFDELREWIATKGKIPKD